MVIECFDRLVSRLSPLRRSRLCQRGIMGFQGVSPTGIFEAGHTKAPGHGGMSSSALQEGGCKNEQKFWQLIGNYCVPTDVEFL